MNGDNGISMRRKTCGLLAVFVLLLVAARLSTSATHAPHNETNGVHCDSCHMTFSQTPEWWNRPPVDIDDQSLNRVCWQAGCHDGVARPFMKTHSSLSTSPKYGEWTWLCVTCHDPHQQRQAYYNEFLPGLKGKITAVNAGTKTFTLSISLPDRSGDAEPADDYAGWTIVPNRLYKTLNYKIAGNTANTVTVTGAIQTARVPAGADFGILPGRYVKEYIRTPGGAKTTKFYSREGERSFAHNDGLAGGDDSSPDGICQVCHGIRDAGFPIRHSRADGTLISDHNSGYTCTVCHPHTDGFRASCGNCHNAPPSTGKHAVHFGDGTVAYGSAVLRSTADAYGFSCGVCHNGAHLNTSGNPHTVEVSFAGIATQDQYAGTASYARSSNSVDDPGRGWTFNYSDGTCSNIYCHGNYPGSGKNAPVTFNSGSAPCGSCHNASNTATPASGKHDTHTSSSTYEFKCTLCHNDVVGGTSPAGYTITDKSRHVNGYVDYKFDPSDPRVAGGTYSIATGTAAPTNGTDPRALGSCSNIYCHSNVQPEGGVGGPSSYSSPSWGSAGTAVCGSCHAGGHGAPLGTGSHTAHLDYTLTTTADYYKCGICHKWNTAASLNSCAICHNFALFPQYPKHANYQVDLVFDATFGNPAYNGSFTPGNGYSNCSNTYCHSNGTSVSTGTIPANTTPDWGSGSLACSSCHGSAPAYDNGSPKANSHGMHVIHSVGDCSNCHYATTTNGSTIADKAKHVNKTYDLQPKPGYSFTYSYAADGGTCTTNACHGDAKWGSLDAPAGSGCIACHGHDAGYEYSSGQFSQGKGTFRSHSTHTENDSDDLRGPHIACDACHDTANFPYFRSGTDSNGDGRYSLDETDVCSSCHSPEGTYDGVNDPVIGAKKNWKAGVYDGTMLQAGKEKWCAGCHDNGTSAIGGVNAPNVIGDETGAYTYGTGWGFYKTGHGLPSAETYPASGGTTAGAGVTCGSCHDLAAAHTDGNARTYDDGNSSTLDPSSYRQGYRLKMVAAGQGTGASTREPMLVPWPGSTVNSANNYRLCVNCHNSGPFINSSDMTTNMVTDGVNRHAYHLSFTYQLRYSSDWDSTVNSQINCVACHNVHGSTRLAMVRDGKLIAREPGLQIWYNNSAIVNPTTPPDTQDLPLSASTGMIWIPGSSSNLCGHCHGGGVSSIEDRTPYQNVQQTPTLAWTGENGYTNDGVNPNSGPGGGSFTFRVKYTDTNNNAPTTYQVWVDTNDNGVYDAGEKINMSEVDSVDKNYYNGKLYTYTMTLSKYGDNTFSYRFKFSDGTVDATGDPASDRPVTVTNNAPVLSWTGEPYYQDSGVYPAAGGNNATYTFSVNFKDADNECPPAASDIQVWIDENNNGTYDPGEKQNMTAADGNACSSGRVYTYGTTLAHAGDGELSYTFRASDGFAQAAADAEPLSDNIVTVLAIPNTSPQLDWESGACRTEGVSPRTGAAGADFTFLVKYTDQNNSCPASGSGNIQVWIDENNNGTYEPGEKYNLTEVEAGDTDCTNGKLYKTTRTLAYAGDGNLKYRFFATDGSLTALGDPADSDSTVTVVTGARKVRPTGGSGWYSTIQSAVAANQTILVYPNADFTAATYNESVFVNNTHNVTIRSVCGPDYAIIDGVGSGYAVWGNASNNLTIDGLSLTGDTNGAYFNNSSPTAVSNCKIHNNTDGGILAQNGANLTISNCEINSNGNSLLIWGGGVYVFGGTHTIENSVIRNNTSGYGGGIATNGANVTITNTTVEENTAASEGGGVYMAAGTVNLRNSTISGNTSTTAGGGLYTNSSPTVNIENCLLVKNRGTAGGMLYLNSGTVTVRNCTIADNQATSGNGGAIYTNNIAVIVRNSIFWNNLAFGDGHNLYKNGVLLANGSTITDSDIMTGRYYIGNCVPTYANNIAADPFFVGSDNYHLQANSPAIDLANAAYAPADDRDGIVRPQGAGNDMGAYEFASGVPETEAPVVTNFTATSPSSNRNIPITAFTAADNTGVTGYRITTSPTPPSASEGGWSAAAPATYLVTSDGIHILYPWAKDASGNVSAAFGSPATVVVDATAPNVTAFTATSPSTILTIPITSFTATDAVGVTGYQITTNSTLPAAGGGGWSGTEPTTYSVSSEGTYTLYPWAKDAIGNVSAVYATPVTVIVDTTPPTVSSTTPSTGAAGVMSNSPVTINWDENVDCSTVSASTVTISPASGWIRTSCVGSQAVYSLSGQSNSTLYSVTVSTSVKDAAGNAMASPYEFSYTTAAVSNYAPALNWASATNCLAEGVRPRTGAINADFEFRVKYSDADDQCPTSMQVTVNGSPYDLTSNDGASCQTGRTYYRTITVGSAGDLNYSFAASDGIDNATGTPTTNHTVSVINTTYKVRPTGGSGWYSTIADALTASPASSTVLVYPNTDFTAATYAGGLSNINKTNRTLQSVCGADLAIISGGANVISLQGNDGAVIDGFSITAGTTYGIYSNADSLTVKNSKIYSNPTGIHLNNGCNPANIQDTAIYSNTSNGINSPSILNLVSITNSTIYNNGGGITNGPGINLNGGAGTHTITNVSLTGNTTTGNGGAIYCVNCAVNIDDSTINNNTAGSGGALYFLNPSVNATITDTFIQGNQATGTLGGAIYMGNGAESLTNVMLNGNKAATNGGAIYINGGTTNLLYSTLSGNYAGGYGGALYQNSSTQTTIQNSIIYNNDALNGGNYKQIFATSPRYTYIDVYYTLINQLPGANISGPPDQRCSYENMGGNLHEGTRTDELPYFVNGLNPPAAPNTGGDYRICGGTNTPVAGCSNVSWGIDTGSSSWTSNHDIFADPRPIDGPDADADAEYDMGADEYRP